MFVILVVNNMRVDFVFKQIKKSKVGFQHF